MMEASKRQGRGRGRGNPNNSSGDLTQKPVNQSRPNVQPRNFQKACAEIQESLEKFNFTQELSDSDSEEDQENEAILQKVLQSYKSGDNNNSTERTQQFLVESLTSGGIVCLICIEAVKKTQAIWACHSCFGIFHLPCIQKWATDSIQIQRLALEETPQSNKTIQWCCPKCRFEYSIDEKPKHYKCFCEKTNDPIYDAWLVPHSCGQVCGQALKPKCGHSCLLLCHPGPCPPCAQTVRSSCYCGIQQPTIRRCSKREWACGKVCGHKLTCGQHTCNKQCHSGDCPSCQKQSLQKCNCGREKVLKECATPDWQCSNVCGKPYSCGHHSCLVICHTGKCNSCPQQGIRNCPCGKTRVDLPCTEKVSPCGDTCEKVLECGMHRCAQRCHVGPCGACLQVVTKRCHCGVKEKSIPCSKDYTCESKCKKLRNCKKHPCSRKCCERECPPCEQICGRTLPCRNHKCNSQCHQGPCYPCPLTVTVTCNCGKTKITVPCGREKATKPPKCKQLCKALPNCHHPKRDEHRCHFGTCPLCRQICDNTIKKCGHNCPRICHDVVLIKTQSDHKRAGPWEPIPAPKIELKSFPCPPCKVMMPLKCLGKHVTHDFPCSELHPWSCGRKCGRKLACENHTCSRECHENEAVANDSLAGVNCKPCNETCIHPRPKDCTHKCLKPCHSDICEPCKLMIRKQCHCQLNSVYIICGKWTQENEETKIDMMSCQNRCPKEMSCGHRCPKTCHLGPCAEQDLCKKRITLRCACKHLKQEIPCNSKDEKASKLQCDSSCKEMKMKENAFKEAEEQKKREMEERKQQRELEEYSRKYEGKKKKNRKQRDQVEEQPNVLLSLRAKILICSLFVAIISFFFVN